MSEKGSYITWNKPLVGRIIINKWYIWFTTIPSSLENYIVYTASLKRLLVLNMIRWLYQAADLTH